MFKAIRTAIVLGLVCSISAFCLAQVYQKTKDKIAAQSQPETFLNNIFPEGKIFDKKTSDKQTYFLVYDREEILKGLALPVTTKGYGGEIKLLVGLDLDGRVVNFLVMKQNETPGLGAKIAEPDFKKQFVGRSKEELTITRIEAITSATISSRAVVKGIRKAIEFYEKYVGAGRLCP